MISKALSVQVKAKGRGTSVLHTLTGDSGATAVTLASLTSPKPVPGEGSVRDLRWYLHGSMDQEVAAEVMKLLKNMTEVGPRPLLGSPRPGFGLCTAAVF